MLIQEGMDGVGCAKVVLDLNWDLELGRLWCCRLWCGRVEGYTNLP